MINTPQYKVNLYLNGTLIGDCRKLAQKLTYTRRRTKVGADSIDFTLNDVLFSKWCSDHNTDIGTILKPMALECRVLRNSTEVVGGFLATMPSYSPLHSSANLDLKFDGFLNLLDGFYIRNTSTNLPYGTVTGAAHTVIQNLITMANNRSSTAGKSFGLTVDHSDTLASITNTFDNYKTLKEWVCERCDNISGAGPFDLYFHADKTYDIYADSNFGDVITDWVAFYPTLLNAPSITSIKASEKEDFASAVIGLGAGEISSNANENTVLFRFSENSSAVSEFGYKETLYQDSSISTASVLEYNMGSQLALQSDPIWQPQIVLHGRHVSPMPSGDKKIWIGDTITINNSSDLTGMTNGQFRVNELKVEISAAGDETITPVLERVSV